MTLLLALAGPVKQVSGFRLLGAVNRIESEEVVNAVLKYASGATGVMQAATAFWPEMPERIEVHGTRGTAVITGGRLTTWDVEDDDGEPPPLVTEVAPGASDPMAISTVPFESRPFSFAQPAAGFVDSCSLHYGFSLHWGTQCCRRSRRDAQ